MEGPLCASSGAAAGPSSSFNQSRELGAPMPRSGGVRGEERSVPLSAAARAPARGGAGGGEWTGLGLLSGQYSGCIRGRLNLPGNVDGDKLFPSL